MWSVLEFVLSHGFAFSSLGLVLAIAAAVALAIFVPGSVTLIRTMIAAVVQGLQWLIGTTTGRVILLAVACLAIGWGSRAYLDDSIEVRRKLAAQVHATEVQRAAAAAAQAAAAEARRQAAALDQANAAASRRAESAEAEATQDAEQAADLADQLAAADKVASTVAGKVGAAKRTCGALTAADIDALARIGARRAKP